MIKTEDNFKEPDYNPFDAPIPGQSLTDEPGNYPWEHSPKFDNPEEVLEILFDRVTEPEVTEQLLMLIESGVPIEAIARVITFTGFVEGEFNPDVGFLLAEPVMKMLTAIAVRAGVKNIRMSLEDDTSANDIKELVNLKEAESRTIGDMPSQVEQPEAVGLLSKPGEES
tara:strand:- start:145 stop:651 length:507 start_codon:yes stop_codon:yes gene_type:complete